MTAKTKSNVVRDRSETYRVAPKLPAAAPSIDNTQVKGLIDRLCDKLWAAGVTNPITYVEQISYLVFLKMLDEMEADREREARLSKRPFKPMFAGKNEPYRWSEWTQITDTTKLYKFVRDDVFDFMRGLGNREDVRRFFADAQLQIPDGHTLRDCLDLFRDFSLSDLDTDIKGDLYENLLQRLGTQAQAGQFLTPRHLIRAIVKMVDPQIGQRILDPAFGTGGFLVAAYEHIKLANSDPKSVVTKINGNGQPVSRGYGDKLSQDQWKFLKQHTFFGFDVDRHIVNLGTMNLVLHDLDRSTVERRDSIAGPADKWDDEQFDVILANPPFSGSMNTNRIRDCLPVESTKTEILFLGLMIRALREGGHCGVIVPEGLLFGATKSHREIRRMLLEKCDVQAVVSFPGGCFKPYSGVKTSALIFSKVGSDRRADRSAANDGAPGGRALPPATKSVWFYEVTGDGFSLDDKRQPAPDKNDIPDLLAKWPKRALSDHSWLATVEQIRAADFNLTAGRYKPVSVEVANHDDPKKILREVTALETEIADRAGKLLKQL
jgi:type I restriction enzyme M protein